MIYHFAPSVEKTDNHSSSAAAAASSSSSAAHTIIQFEPPSARRVERRALVSVLELLASAPALTSSRGVAGSELGVHSRRLGRVEHNLPRGRGFCQLPELEEEAALLPWGRLGTPADIGQAAAFLCSAEADYITGSVLAVDGGFRAKDCRAGE